MPELIESGKFYSLFTADTKYTTRHRMVVENTVAQLLKMETSVERPGMLLGRIQSGKTRNFIRIIALAFDNGFDLAIVLTKGTRALTHQTFERLKDQFQEFGESDEVQLFDIMHLPDTLVRYELRQKLIIVAKKEKNNLVRLIHALKATYPELQQRRTLIIDDEADFASVGFKRSKDEGLEINKIAQLIDDLRQLVTRSSFLQVTATPYSLYLQPSTVEIADRVFRPIRPAFTGSLPAYDGYIGGDFYFNDSLQEDSLASYIFEQVPDEEIKVVRKKDGRVLKLEDVLTSKKIHALRTAVMNFIVGACIRRLQSKMAQKTEGQKYSFIVHTERGMAAHEWQHEIVTAIKNQLANEAQKGSSLFEELVHAAVNDLKRSIAALDYPMPELARIRAAVAEAMADEYVMITKVNSDKEVEQLLDSKGQLKLRTPMNIFIGGQILDRGITVGNLIGFYYGRNPQRFQQDTVLQHSRMYGARPKDDLAVTRFYTTLGIYDSMRRIHEMDASLREALESGNEEIVFIRADEKGRILPCSPNKILASTTTTLKPNKRVLPIGFQTGYKSYISKTIESIDTTLDPFGKEPQLMTARDAKHIVEAIFSTYESDDEYSGVGKEEFVAILDYLSSTAENSNPGEVWCIVRRGRQISRYREDYGYSDLPENRRDELALAKEYGAKTPVLILLRQEGLEEHGWRGTPFYWPVLVAPSNTKTAIYARDLEEDQEITDLQLAV